MSRPLLGRVLAVTALTAAGWGLVLASAPGVAAHPLGNFTVNYATGLSLRPDGIDARIVVDRAEIAALQERPLVDRDGNGRVDAAEARSYGRSACAPLAGQLRVEVGDRPVVLTVAAGAFSYRPGAAGLRTSRLECRVGGRADLRQPSVVAVHTGYDTTRIGWREITARGQGIVLTRSDVPAVSATDELRRYPKDPLAARPDERTATLRTRVGHAAAAGPAAAGLPGAGPFTAVTQAVSGTFDSLVGSRELTLPVGLLALFLAVVLGASHAAMPGHGKTVMAAYLAGRRGRPLDAVTVGATVTLTHTAGVLVLGLLLPAVTTLAGETVLTWLGCASGLVITGVGVWLLRAAVLKRPLHENHHHHHHGPGPGPGPGHGPGSGHNHGPGDHHHSHDHHHGPATPKGLPPSGPGPAAAPARQEAGTAVALATEDAAYSPTAHSSAPHSPTHSHAPADSASRTSRGGLIGLGIAGGLVPSPSALVVLLGAVALGRTAFGILLVVGYGLGMAATLTLAGLLLVRVRDRMESARATGGRGWALAERWARFGPVATSGLVLLVGLGLTVRAAAGPW